MQIRLDRQASIGLGVAALAVALLAGNTVRGLWSPGHAYSVATGYALLTVFASMWLLPGVRAGTANPAGTLKRWHELGGIALLAMVGLHAVSFRQNLLLWLSVLIALEGVLGLLHPKLVTPYSEGYFRAWWFGHITLGCTIAGMTVTHLYSAYAWGG